MSVFLDECNHDTFKQDYKDLKTKGAAIRILVDDKWCSITGCSISFFAFGIKNKTHCKNDLLHNLLLLNNAQVSTDKMYQSFKSVTNRSTFTTKISSY